MMVILWIRFSSSIKDPNLANRMRLMTVETKKLPIIIRETGLLSLRIVRLKLARRISIDKEPTKGIAGTNHAFSIER